MRRTGPSAPRSAAFVVILTGAVLAASCASGGTIEQVSSPRQLRTSTTLSPATVAPTTEPATTAPGTDPSTAVPPSTAAPATPATPPAPVPGGEGPGDPSVAPEAVRPPPGWVGFGVPQEGTMFENLREDHSLDGKGPIVALTFDDGPSQYTQQIVDILRYLGVQATFFQISNQTVQRPDLVRLMAAAGMRIGAHSRSHPHLRSLDPAGQSDQVFGSIDAINGVVGPGTVKCFRPPYAEYDQHVIDLARTHAVSMAMWSYDTLDWKKPAWNAMAARVVEQARDRDVILMHDGGGDRTATVQALPWIIQGLRQRGFTIIPIC